MAKITNIGPCPPAIVDYVRRRLRTSRTRKDNQHWFLRLFVPVLGEIEYEVDVRWLSECNVEKKTCMGYLLGRWDIAEENFQPLEYDFLPNPGDLEFLEGAIVDVAHNVLLDFAFTPDERSCIIRITDLKGLITIAQYEMPDGIRSRTLGERIGPVVNLFIDRNKPGACVPPGWRAWPTDSDQE